MDVKVTESRETGYRGNFKLAQSREHSRAVVGNRSASMQTRGSATQF